VFEVRTGFSRLLLRLPLQFERNRNRHQVQIRETMQEPGLDQELLAVGTESRVRVIGSILMAGGQQYDPVVRGFLSGIWA
jgi:hypothetical protein